MTQPAPATPAERLALILDLLCGAIAARGVRGVLGGLSVILVWMRVRRLAARFTHIATHAPAPSPARPAAPRPRRAKAPPRLPTGRAWLVRLLPDAASAGSQLRYLLDDADMAALIAADPRTGRVLRPLCRMLGLDPPPSVAKPPTPKQPTPKPPTPKPPAATPPAATPPAIPPPHPARPAAAAPTRPRRPRPRRRTPAACAPPLPA